VRDLVQGDPAQEAVLVDLEVAHGALQVGRDEEEPWRDLGLEQRHLVLAEHPLRHVTHDEPHLGRERRARGRLQRPRERPGVAEALVEAFTDRLEQLRERIEVGLRPVSARDLMHRRRGPAEIEPAVGGNLAERFLGGVFEAEREGVPVVRSRRETRDLPG
jgi:hypothetical protein